MAGESEYFDAGYYRKQVRALDGKSPKNLVGHYAAVGWRLGLDPHPEFSTNGYLADNPDVRREGFNPLNHFEQWGREEKRQSVSVADYERRTRANKLVRRVELFDLAYYQSQVPAERFPDALNALDHYLEKGWRSGLDPHPSFSTSGYLHDNLDVAESGNDPLTHYVRHGLAEGRAIVDPLDFAQPGYKTPDSQWAADVRESLGLYLEHFGIDFDVAEIDLRGGTLDLRGEYEWFDAEFYLRKYADVANAAIPALTHFVVAGHREGRFPNAAIYEERSLKDNIQRVLLARTSSLQSHDGAVESGAEIRTGAEVVTEILDRQLIAGSRVVIAFAHDDYVEHVGGIQIVSAQEEVKFRELGDVYISIFPNRLFLALSSSSPREFLVRCRINGELFDAAFPLVEFAAAFSQQFSENEVVVVVHSVLGHAPEAIRESIEVLQPSTACWWVHDFSAHCQNYRLTRNGVNWCGDPAPESQSCQLCAYGPVRVQHVNRIHSLFDGVDWTFAAPSAVAADQSMSGSTPLPIRPVVIPHGVIRREGALREPCSANDKVRVAFVGHPAAIKGWNHFTAFVSDAGLNADDFEFFHFGVESQFVPSVTFIELRPSPGGRSVTTELLLENRIDAVANLVEGKETFNFVTFEAMAAGCCVLTSLGSGNVVVAAESEGLLVQVEDGVMGFDYEAIRDEIRRKRRCDIGRFHITGLTPALLSVVSNGA